ncbi:hypothetical protein AB0C07_32355 [Actinoplanes missouriensis]|uniref:hypothetical protein n=1 Tax=Actinoplanes missouriensis TaxID=1866 RepID=UPI0033E4B5E8
MFRWFRALATVADTRDHVLQLQVPPVPVTGGSGTGESPAGPADELTELRAEVADLRSRVVALSGVSDEDDLVHDNLAELYHNLVTQQLREVARLRWGRIRRDRPVTDGPMAQARLVRDLVGLIVTGGADEGDLIRWLASDGTGDPTDADRRTVEGACVQARRLRAGIATSVKVAMFAEDVPRGKPLAEGAGRPWPGCPADGTVAFVVAPAYVLRGRVLTEPLVFTEVHAA